MTLARIGSTSLFLGLWTPVVALAIVWATASSGTPIVFALEGAGIEGIDRAAVALVLVPPLPYLLALAALGLGIAAGRLAPEGLGTRAVGRCIRAWFIAGLMISALAPLSLYAEHGTAHEPLDEVHLALWIAAWTWWSITASAVTVAVVLRMHGALLLWAARSRAFAGAAVGVGIASMTVASVAVAPRPARAALVEWLPGVDAVSSETEAVVLALAGSPSSGGTVSGRASSVRGGAASDGDPSGGDDDRYGVSECLGEIYAAVDNSKIQVLQSAFRSVDVADVVSATAIEFCEDRPRRSGNLGGMLYDATQKRVVDQLRRNATAHRNEFGAAALLYTRTNEHRRLESSDLLECLMAGLSDNDRSLLEDALMERTPAEVADRRAMTYEAAAKAMVRAKARAKLRGPYCDESLR